MCVHSAYEQVSGLRRYISNIIIIIIIIIDITLIIIVSVYAIFLGHTLLYFHSLYSSVDMTILVIEPY